MTLIPPQWEGTVSSHTLPSTMLTLLFSLLPLLMLVLFLPFLSPILDRREDTTYSPWLTPNTG